MIVACVIALFMFIELSSCIQYPTKLKDIVSRMTQVTQRALKNQISRMEIELPPIADFGVEKRQKSSSDIELIKISNREAARLFTEMFSSISSTITVLFPTELEANAARNIWGTTSYRGKIVSMDASSSSQGYGKLRSRKFSAMEQEQALLANQDGVYIPTGTEVLIVVGPRAKDIKKVKAISAQLTAATLIILLNSRPSLIAHHSLPAATTPTTGVTTDVIDAMDSTASSTTSRLTSRRPTNRPTSPSASRLSSVDSAVVGVDDTSAPTAELPFDQWVYSEYESVFHYCPPFLPDAVSISEPSRVLPEADRVQVGSTVEPSRGLISTCSPSPSPTLRPNLILYHEYGGKWSLVESASSSASASSSSSASSATSTGSGGGGLWGAISELTSSLGVGNGGLTTVWEGDNRPSPQVLHNIITSLR